MSNYKSDNTDLQLINHASNERGIDQLKQRVRLWRNFYAAAAVVSIARQRFA